MRGKHWNMRHSQPKPVMHPHSVCSESMHSHSHSQSQTSPVSIVIDSYRVVSCRVVSCRVVSCGVLCCVVTNSYYMMGIGVKEDKKISIQFYQAAATQGSVLANFTLGLCWEVGSGTSHRRLDKA